PLSLPDALPIFPCAVLLHQPTVHARGRIARRQPDGHGAAAADKLRHVLGRPGAHFLIVFHDDNVHAGQLLIENKRLVRRRRQLERPNRRPARRRRRLCPAPASLWRGRRPRPGRDWPTPWSPPAAAARRPAAPWPAPRRTWSAGCPPARPHGPPAGPARPAPVRLRRPAGRRRRA